MKPDHRSAVERLSARLAAAGVAAPAGLGEALVEILGRMADEPQNLTAVRDLGEAVDRHLADSLVALLMPEVGAARSIVDIGSGGGFPGVPLAAALPHAEVTLVESEGRKARWLERCAGDFPNLRVVADRSEHLAARERERRDLATVRAVAAPAVALELAAPLLAVGGHAVLWRTADGEPALDADARAAADALGFARAGARPVAPFPGARRVLESWRKVAPTPERFPRRAGRAAKRPLGAAR